MLEGGKKILVSINPLENIWSQIVLRIKKKRTLRVGCSFTFKFKGLIF